MSERGFSLLEAVVALGVASFVLVATYHAMGDSLRIISHTEGRYTQLADAENALHRATQEGLSIGEREIETQSGEVWRVVVARKPEISIEDEDGVIIAIESDSLFEVSVFRQDGGEKPVLKTLRYAEGVSP
ncbi:MAG: prepilin-type N-terminal cleavage/methylation domain-containing protein [Pseudomonadota bacterium]